MYKLGFATAIWLHMGLHFTLSAGNAGSLCVLLLQACSAHMHFNSILWTFNVAGLKWLSAGQMPIGASFLQWISLMSGLTVNLGRADSMRTDTHLHVSVLQYGLLSRVPTIKGLEICTCPANTAVFYCLVPPLSNRQRGVVNHFYLPRCLLCSSTASSACSSWCSCITRACEPPSQDLCPAFDCSPHNVAVTNLPKGDDIFHTEFLT